MVAPCDMGHRRTGTVGSQPEPLALHEEPGLEPDTSPHILLPHRLTRENECVVLSTNHLSPFPSGGPMAAANRAAPPVSCISFD